MGGHLSYQVCSNYDPWAKNDYPRSHQGNGQLSTDTMYLYIRFKQNSGERFRFIWRSCFVHKFDCQSNNSIYHMGLDARKPVFGGSEKWDSYQSPQLHRLPENLQFMLVASLDMILSNTRITKALISMMSYLGVI